MGGGGGGEYNRHWIFLFGEEKKNEVIIRSRYRSQPQFLSEFNSVQLGLPPVNFQITPIFTSRTVSQSRRVTHTQSHTRHRITSPLTQTSTCRRSLPAPSSAMLPPPAADNSLSSTRCAASRGPLSPIPLSDSLLPTTPRLLIGVARPRG